MPSWSELQKVAELARVLRGKQESTPSVMDNYQPPAPAVDPRTVPGIDAIGPPTIGGVSIDPTDYIGPGFFKSMAAAGAKLMAAKSILPALAGVTVHKLGDIKILESPTRDMVKNLAESSPWGEVRGLRDPVSGSQYWWDAGKIDHKPVSDFLGLNWDDILNGSDQTRKLMSSTSINGTPWKFSGE